MWSVRSILIFWTVFSEWMVLCIFTCFPVWTLMRPECKKVPSGAFVFTFHFRLQGNSWTDNQSEEWRCDKCDKCMVTNRTSTILCRVRVCFGRIGDSHHLKPFPTRDIQLQLANMALVLQSWSWRDSTPDPQAQKVNYVFSLPGCWNTALASLVFGIISVGVGAWGRSLGICVHYTILPFCKSKTYSTVQKF